MGLPFHKCLQHCLINSTGCLTYSPQKEAQTKMNTTFYLGSFQSSLFNENLMENIDETHFSINMDNGKTLGFCGDTIVKYADVVAGGEAMTIVVRNSGGRSINIEAPMLIFTNLNSNYPIRTLHDNIPGVCHQTSPKGWINQSLFP